MADPLARLSQQYLDIAGVIVLVLDGNGDITLLNRKGHEVLECANGDLIGRNWVETCLPARERTRVRAVFQQLMAGDVPAAEHVENLVQTRSGRERLIAWRNTLLRDEAGKCIGTLSSGEDITDRRRAEEALRQSEERYRSVVEDQTEIISRFRADGTITFVNDVYCRFFGKTSQELLGQKWQPAAVPDDVSRIEKQLHALSPANPVVVVENRVCSGHGQVRWMQFVNRGFFDRQGQLVEIQSVGRDITDRRRAEERCAERGAIPRRGRDFSRRDCTVRV